jgi:hypothetical protein
MNTFARVPMLASFLVLAPLITSSPAVAADPPDSWENLRVLDCAGTQVTTYLSPAGFGTPYHVVGSTDVINPMHVVAQLPGGQIVTSVDVPGFDPTRSDAVHCTYTDPAGVFVTLDGYRN